jgi:uncharacterized protein YkwD
VGRKATELIEPAGLPKGIVVTGTRRVGGVHRTCRPFAMEVERLVPRKLLPLAIALVALAIPASAQAGFTAQRVAQARVALGHAPAVARAAQVPATCANADVTPNAGNLEAVRAAIVCLHNQVRARNGLPLLKGNTKLRRAAEGHSAEMVQKRYFDHTSPAGSTMVDRILAARYVRANQGWSLGENLEWGTGSLATPRGAMESWMGSPGHRANILQRSFREMGVGVVTRVPVSDTRGATYTVDFGVRR